MGETDSRRVLVVGDRVDELRAQAAGKLPLQLRDVEPVLVHRDGHDVGLEAAEGHDRPEIRRRLDDHDVAAVEERLADELERLDRAARDHQLVVGRSAALQRVEPGCDRVERAGEPSRRRVLERSRLACGGELLE